jgi:hypothetical protein
MATPKVTRSSIAVGATFPSVLQQFVEITKQLQASLILDALIDAA